MERRRFPRFTVDESVQLKVLGGSGGPWDVRIVDASANGMRLRVPASLSAGSLVQIEGRDTLLLGEVLYCVDTSEDGYFLGVELSSALFGLADLRRLNRSLISSSTEARHPSQFLPSRHTAAILKDSIE